jgi:hypothetical protein
MSKDFVDKLLDMIGKNVTNPQEILKFVLEHSPQFKKTSIDIEQ